MNNIYILVGGFLLSRAGVCTSKIRTRHLKRGADIKCTKGIINSTITANQNVRNLNRIANNKKPRNNRGFYLQSIFGYSACSAVLHPSMQSPSWSCGNGHRAPVSYFRHQPRPLSCLHSLHLIISSPTFQVFSFHGALLQCALSTVNCFRLAVVCCLDRIRSVLTSGC